VTLRRWIEQRWQGYELPDDPEQASPGRDIPVSVTLTVELMVPVVRALAHAHAMGLVHRDLKPENVMLADDGVIKVLDFGLAKLLDPLASPLSSMTSHEDWAAREFETGEGTFLGTLPYMAPEQFGVDDIDERSDLWAVGILLWELCTGRHPLGQLTPARLEGIKNLAEPMPRLAGERPDLGPLAEIVDRCLRKRKAERMA
jgi:serine/threonine protein kinase